MGCVVLMQNPVLCLPFSVYCQLRTVPYSVFLVCYSLFRVYLLLFTAYCDCQLLTVPCLLFTAHRDCSLFTVYGFLSFVTAHC